MAPTNLKRKDLSSVYHLNRELEQWTKRLNRLHANKGKVGSPSDMEVSGVHSGIISNPVQDEALDIADTEAIINGILAEIRIKQREIVRHVETIDDSLLRQIVMCRCFDCMSWIEVAFATGSSEDAVKKMFYRAYPT